MSAIILHIIFFVNTWQNAYPGTMPAFLVDQAFALAPAEGRPH